MTLRYYNIAFIVLWTSWKAVNSYKFYLKWISITILIISGNRSKHLYKLQFLLDFYYGEIHITGNQVKL